MCQYLIDEAPERAPWWDPLTSQNKMLHHHCHHHLVPQAISISLPPTMKSTWTEVGRNESWSWHNPSDLMQKSQGSKNFKYCCTDGSSIAWTNSSGEREPSPSLSTKRKSSWQRLICWYATPLQNPHHVYIKSYHLWPVFSAHMFLSFRLVGFRGRTCPNKDPTSKRSWYSMAILRLSSMTISASLAALARVSLMNRAVTTRITAKTTKALGLLGAFWTVIVFVYRQNLTLSLYTKQTKQTKNTYKNPKPSPTLCSNMSNTCFWIYRSTT